MEKLQDNFDELNVKDTKIFPVGDRKHHRGTVSGGEYYMTRWGRHYLIKGSSDTPKLQDNFVELDYEDTKLKLKQLLDNSCSNKKTHTERIMKLPTLKDVHIYCKCENLIGQVAGPAKEKYVKTKNKMTKNKASSCTGDLKYNKINYEYKGSNGGKENNKFNFVQLRMNHDCEYILSAYYINYTNLENLGELFIFKLNKENIKQLILKHGRYAHGGVNIHGEITIEDLNDTTNTKLYELRPKYGDKCWNELLNFRIDEIDI